MFLHRFPGERVCVWGVVETDGESLSWNDDTREKLVEFISGSVLWPVVNYWRHCCHHSSTCPTRTSVLPASTCRQLLAISQTSTECWDAVFHHCHQHCASLLLPCWCGYCSCRRRRICTMQRRYDEWSDILMELQSDWLTTIKWRLPASYQQKWPMC